MPSIRRSYRSAFRPAVEFLEDRNLLSAGSLDPTFGVGGEVTINYRPGDQSSLGATAVQADGKLIIAGVSRNDSPSPSTAAVVVERLNSDGSIDTSFGKNGEVILTQTGTWQITMGVAADGKIVVESVVGLADGSKGAYVARLNADGTFDTSFAGTGSEISSFGTTALTINALSLQPDGKIVLVGDTGTNTRAFFAARLNNDGSHDDSFGQHGASLVPFDTLNASATTARNVVVQNDGKLVLVGGASSAGFDFEGALARLNADGSLDTSFGQGGEVLFASCSRLDSVALRGDDIVVAGGGGLPAHGFVALLHSNGSPDLSFGIGGQVVDSGSEFFYRVAVSSDGSLVLLGQSFVGATVGWTTSVTKLEANGLLDTSFGDSGRVFAFTYPQPFFLDDNNADLCLMANGDIVIGGHTSPVVRSPITGLYGIATFGVLARLTSTPGDSTGSEIIVPARSAVEKAPTTDSVPLSLPLDIPTPTPVISVPGIAAVLVPVDFVPVGRAVPQQVSSLSPGEIQNLVTTGAPARTTFQSGLTIPPALDPTFLTGTAPQRPVLNPVAPLPEGGGMGGESSDSALIPRTNSVVTPDAEPSVIAVAFSQSEPVAEEATGRQGATRAWFWSTPGLEHAFADVPSMFERVLNEPPENQPEVNASAAVALLLGSGGLAGHVILPTAKRRTEYPAPKGR